MSNEWYDIDSWQWVDNDNAQWGFSVSPIDIGYSGLNQIWTDNKYVYAATTSGLDIISIETELRQVFVTNTNGYSSVWSDNEEIFIGSNRGIKFFNQSSVEIEDVFTLLSDYVLEPDINNNNVRYLHGNINRLICCTAAGIDIIRRDTHYITHTNISGATKCFVTPNYNYYYYTVSGTAISGVAPWYLCRLNDNTSDWATPDIMYTTNSGFLVPSTCINDFYVTEHTSTSGINNTLFIATDIGVYVYDEGSAEYSFFTISL
jgi:hypothetical protein